MTDKFKAWFGFALLFMIVALATVIALGKVQEQNSFGLQIILGCITTLAGGYSNWAFRSNDKDDK